MFACVRESISVCVYGYGFTDRRELKTRQKTHTKRMLHAPAVKT